MGIPNVSSAHRFHEARDLRLRSQRRTSNGRHNDPKDLRDNSSASANRWIFGCFTDWDLEEFLPVLLAGPVTHSDDRRTHRGKQRASSRARSRRAFRSSRCTVQAFAQDCAVVMFAKGFSGLRRGRGHHFRWVFMKMPPKPPHPASAPKVLPLPTDPGILPNKQSKPTEGRKDREDLLRAQFIRIEIQFSR